MLMKLNTLSLVLNHFKALKIIKKSALIIKGTVIKVIIMLKGVIIKMKKVVKRVKLVSY